MRSSLQTYRRANRYSQNGEDGVIAEIMRRLGVQEGWFCEFGAWDGRYGSNCYALLEDGWKGVMIEGMPARYRQLERLARRHEDRLVAIEAYVAHEPGSSQTLDKLLAATPIDREFALLSIDVDGCDYQIWESLEFYRPIVIVVEITSAVPPGVSLVHGKDQEQTSFSAMLALAQRKGYSLACHTGNMIFVRDDYFGRLDLPARERAYPELLFVGDWLNPTRLQRWERKLRHMTWQRLRVKLANAVAGILPERQAASPVQPQASATTSMVGTNKRAA